MLYCLKRKESLYISCVGFSSSEAWDNAFDLMSSACSPEWNRKYLKRERAFRAWAKKSGYSVVKCALVEIK